MTQYSLLQSQKNLNFAFNIHEKLGAVEFLQHNSSICHKFGYTMHHWKEDGI